MTIADDEGLACATATPSAYLPVQQSHSPFVAVSALGATLKAPRAAA